MTIDQIKALIESNDLDKLHTFFQISYDVQVIETAIKQYDPKGHDVHNPSLRPNKLVYDERTNNETGIVTKYVTDIKPVSRIAVPMQKQIVLLRSAFIGTPVMESKTEDDKEEAFIELIKKVWDDNKMSYKFAETKKRTMSELRCAWLWYTVEDQEYWQGQAIKGNKVRPKCKLLSPSAGDSLYPVFDGADDLIAFARAYKVEEYNDQYVPVTVQYLDIYTKDFTYYKKKDGAEWVDYAPQQPNIVGKIPITYFAQEVPEWYDVQDACHRLDNLISNHADTNDYFGNPILFGKVGGTNDTLSLPQKGDAGKYIEGTGDADLKFVTWDNAPASIKMEIENLYDIIFGMSQTVQHKDFEKLGEASGFAIQLRFLMPTLKAKDCEMSVFGEGVQRAYNYLKAFIVALDGSYKECLKLKVTPVFESVLPSDENEKLDKIGKAIGFKVMSVETGTEQNPLIEDAEAEKDRLKGEMEEMEAKEEAKLKAQAGLKAAAVAN